MNLREDVLLVCREPEKSRYTDCRTLGRGDSVSPARFPDTQFAVQELIGD